MENRYLIQIDTRLGWINKNVIEFNKLSIGTCLLEFELTDNRVPFDLTDKRVMIEVLTPSGSTIEEIVTIIDAANGKLEKVLSAGMITEQGMHYLELSIYSEDDTKLLCTGKARYSIGENYGEKNVKQSSQYSTLQQCIMDVKEVEGSVGVSADLAGKAQEDAEKARVASMKSASDSIQSSIASQRSAESANETSLTLDEVVRMAEQSAEASKQSAESSKASADESERSKGTVLQLVKQVNAASQVANEASVKAEQSFQETFIAKENAQDAEVKAINSAEEAKKSEISANNSKIILEDKIEEINQVKSEVDVIIDTANEALSQSTIAINEAKFLTDENRKLVLVAGQTTVRADEAIKKTTELHDVAQEKLIETTEQAEISKQQVINAKAEVVKATEQVDLAKDEVLKATQQVELAKGEVVKAKEEVIKATEQVSLATTEADRSKQEADRAGAQAEEKVNAKIGMNNVFDDTNFNFIANEVVSDGLVCKTNGFERFIVGSKAKVANITNQNKVTMMASFSYKGELSAYRKIFHITSTTEGNSAFFIDITGNDSKSYRIRLGENVVFVPTDSVYNKTDLCIALDNENGIAIISINGNVYSYNYIPRETAKIAIGGIVVYSGGQEFIGDLNSCVYNRILTPTEISHNFNVLNNSPSISHLETTDSTGSTTKQLFYADSSHVEMDTGRTVQQELDAYRSIMSKEFTSTGEEITVDNAIESKVIGLSMEGQTVKCIYDEKVVTVIGNGSSWGSSPKILSSIPQLLPNKEYTIFCEVIENTLVHNYNINSPSNIRAFLLNGTKIPPKATGLFASKHMTANSFVGIDYSLYSAFDSNTETGTIKFKRFVVEGDFTDKISSYIPFGLSSTQAQLTVNGHTTKFYEPTISGQTKIVNATGEEVEAGTEGARLVSLEPSGEASLIEGLPSLGSVPSISDTIDRGTREMIINSSDYILINDTSWKIAPWSNTTNTLAFEHPLENCPSKDLKDICICNNFNTKSGQDVFQNDVEAIGVGWNNVVVRVNRSKLTTQDVNGFKAWLQANPTTVRYQLATPQVIQLTPDQVKAYDAHKKQILLSKVGDVADKFEIKEDGSGVINRNTLSDIIASLKPPSQVGNNFKFPINGENYSNCAMSKVLCDRLPLTTSNIGATTPSISHDGWGLYMILQTNDIEVAKSYIGSNFKLQLKAPDITYIPKHIMQTIPTNKINILSAGDAVKASKFTASLPVDRVGELQTELDSIKKQLGAIAAIQHKYI